MPLPKLTQCRSKKALKQLLTPLAKLLKTSLAPLKVAKLLHAAPKVVKLPSAALLSAKLLSNRQRTHAIISV
ncbi:MAG: hypothetical protein WBA51_17100 [Erythrobacter sp.]